MPETIDDFRARYRRENIPRWYNGRVHLAATTTISLAAITGAIMALDDVRPWELLTLPVTFLLANLVEYAGHRGPMHHPVRGLSLVFVRHVKLHHRFFSDERMAFDDTGDFRAVLFPVFLIVFYLGLFATPIALLVALVFPANVALLFVAVAVGYFLNYELLHFAYHAPDHSWVLRLPLVRRLRRLHHLHHRPALMQRGNFNITYPIGDWLFGTLHRAG